MNTNAAAFAFILQQRRDLSATQPQQSSSTVQQPAQYRGHSPRPTPTNTSSAAQQPQYTAAPYQQQCYNVQQPQQISSYTNFNQNQQLLGYSQMPPSIYQQNVPSFDWQQNQQHQQQQSQQHWQQQTASSPYPPTSSSISQFGVPSVHGIPYQPSAAGINYQNQQYQYQYQYQNQASNVNIASGLSIPGIGSHHSTSSSSTSHMGISLPQNHIKNISSSGDSSVDRTQPSEPPQLYYCEGCEKEFTQKTAYDAHCANHEICRHPGCKFSGTKKVVIAHFHGSHGLYSGEGYKMIEVEGSKKKYRVLLGVSPEEIEKWRNDRRKNFPTAENALKKQEQQDELRKAGGLVLEKGKKRKRDDGDSSKKKGPAGSERGAAESTGATDVNEIIINDEEGAEDEGDEGKERDSKPRKKPCVFFVKGSCKQGDQCTYSHDFEIKVCNFFIRSGRCTRGNRCTFAHDKEERAKFLEERKISTEKKQGEKKEDDEGGDDDESNAADIQERRNQKSKMKEASKKKEELNDNELRAKVMKKKGQLFLPKPFAGGSRGTLLRNLLQHEVESEENVLLQCLRLIVLNNYLQPLDCGPDAVEVEIDAALTQTAIGEGKEDE